MEKVMPTAPISDMHLKQKELLKRVDKGPVVLMSRSQPAAVVVSVDEWNRTALQLEVMLAIVRKTRPWFTLPFYTLDDVRQQHMEGAEGETVALDNK